MNEYIKSFVIGSSWPVFILYFYAVSNYNERELNYSYKNYTLIAPVFLGILNVFGLYVSQKLNLSRTQRFLFTGLFGAFCVASFITSFKVYNFSDQRLMQQYVSLFMIYVFVFLVIVNVLDSAI